MAETSPLFGFDPSTTTVVGDYGKAAQAQGDIANAAALAKSQKNPFDFLGVGATAASLASFTSQVRDEKQADLEKRNRIAAGQKNLIDAHQAKKRALEFMATNENLTGHELSDAIAKELKSISEGDNYSTGYVQGTLSVLEIGYGQALKRKEAERVESAFEVVTSGFTVSLLNNFQEGVSIPPGYAEGYASSIAESLNIPIDVARNAMVTSIFKDASLRVAAATDRSELTQALTEVSNLSQHLKSPLFLDSQSKKFKPLVDNFKKTLMDSIKAKEQEFIKAAQIRIQKEFIGDGTSWYNTHLVDPALYTELIWEAAGGDELTFLQSKENLTKIFGTRLGNVAEETAAEAQLFLEKNLYGDGSEEFDTRLVNPESFKDVVLISVKGDKVQYEQVMRDATKKYNAALASLAGEEKEAAMEAAKTWVEINLKGMQDTLESSFPLDPAANLEMLRASTGSDAEFVRLYRELKTKYDAAQADRDAVADFNVMSRNIGDTSGDSDRVTQHKVSEVSKAVTDNIQNPNQLIDIITNNPNHIGQAGKQLTKQFMSTQDPETLTQQKQAFDELVLSPGGSQAAQLMFGDGFKKMMSISVIADYVAEGDVVKAKAIYADSTAALTRGSIDPDLQEDVQKLASKLGGHADSFKFVVNTLANVSQGSVDKDFIKEAYDTFSANIQEIGDETTMEINGGNTAASSLNPELFNQNISEITTNLNGGAPSKNIVNLPNNIMVYSDEFGIPSGVFDSTFLLQVTNDIQAALDINNAQQIDLGTRTKDTFNSIQSFIGDRFDNLYNAEARAAANARISEQLSLIWSGSDAPKGKISEDIQAMKNAYPTTIDASVIKDYDERKNAEERNQQIHIFIDDVADSFFVEGIDAVTRRESRPSYGNTN